MAFKLTRTLLIGLALGAGLGSGSQAQAFQTEIDATLDAQFYSLQSPYGSPLVQRRRYTQTLALNLYDIQADRGRSGPRSRSSRACGSIRISGSVPRSAIPTRPRTSRAWSKRRWT